MMGSSLDEKKEMIKEPLLNPSPKGGLRTMPFIIANGMLERVAAFGLSPNMALYLMRQYHMEMPTASNILFYWSAVTNFTPVIGAIIADSFVGRFHMIGFGSVVSLLGMTLLWLTTMIPQARPPPCNESISHCSSTTIPQLLLLCTSFVLIAVGGGGLRSSSLAFGADQLEKEDEHKNAGMLERYFGWYYATYTLGILIALTCVVYIQDNMGWVLGFGVCVVLMAFSTLSFFLASSFYVKLKAKSSLVIELCQVIVASYKKRHLKFSSKNTNMLCHHKNGSIVFFPTENLRFLNKACIITNLEQELTLDGGATDPWSLCTVDQVEDLKALLKVIPIWSTGMITFVNISQNSFTVLQASSMNRKITANFEIPAGSFGTLSVISVIVWVPLYHRVILPIASRIKGKPIRLGTKHRMGIGIFLSLICMIVTAVVEGVRRSIAIKEGLSDDPQAPVHMSALWLVPQYCLIGFSEGINAIAQNEFYISELPKGMSSLASTLCGVGMSVASLLASFIMSTIDDYTKRRGQESWVSSNINKGHFDYYFWVLSGLSMVNLIYFLICSWSYGPCRAEERKASTDEEDPLTSRTL